MAGHATGGMPRGDLKDLGEALDSGTASLIAVYETNLADQVAANIKAANRVISKETDVDAEMKAEQSAPIPEQAGQPPRRPGAGPAVLTLSGRPGHRVAVRVCTERAYGGHVLTGAALLGGRQVGIRIEPSVPLLFDLDTRELLRTRPNPLTEKQVLRLRGLRPAGPPPQPSLEPVTVQRLADRTGVISVAKQRIGLGRAFARETVTAHVSDHHHRRARRRRHPRRPPDHHYGRR